MVPDSHAGSRHHKVKEGQDTAGPHGADRGVKAAGRLQALHIGIFHRVEFIALGQGLPQTFGRRPVAAVMNGTVRANDIKGIGHGAVGPVVFSVVGINQDPAVLPIAGLQQFRRFNFFFEGLVLVQALAGVGFAYVDQQEFNIREIFFDRLNIGDVLGVHGTGR